MTSDHSYYYTKTLFLRYRNQRHTFFCPSKSSQIFNSRKCSLPHIILFPLHPNSLKTFHLNGKMASIYGELKRRVSQIHAKEFHESTFLSVRMNYCRNWQQLKWKPIPLNKHTHTHTYRLVVVDDFYKYFHRQMSFACDLLKE